MLADIAYFEKGVAPFDSTGLGFFVQGNDDTVIIGEDGYRLSA